MFEGKYGKVLTVILIVAILAIMGLIGYIAFEFINNNNQTKQAADFVDSYEGSVSDEMTNYTDEDLSIDLNEIQTPQTTTSSTAITKKKYKGYTVCGTIKIPSINVEYPVIEEVTTKALDTAVIALYPNGDSLNLPGNTVIIGHNYRNGTFFSNVKKLTNGAKIYVTDFRGTSLTYEIYNIFETSSTDTSFYNRDTNGLAEITLSTCTDASNDQRTIVFAKQI